jgi:hypothetical protein
MLGYDGNIQILLSYTKNKNTTTKIILESKNRERCAKGGRGKDKE